MGMNGLVLHLKAWNKKELTIKLSWKCQQQNIRNKSKNPTSFFNVSDINSIVTEKRFIIDLYYTIQLNLGQ